MLILPQSVGVHAWKVCWTGILELDPIIGLNDTDEVTADECCI